MTATLSGTPAAARAAAVPATSSRLTRQRVRSAWIFLAPLLIVLLVVAGWPLARTIWLSFTDTDSSTGRAGRFVGLDNYLYYGPGPAARDDESDAYFVFDEASGTPLDYDRESDTFTDPETKQPFTGPVDRDAIFDWHGVLVDPGWWDAVRNTFVLTLVSVSIEVVLGMIIALTLNAHIPGRGLLRAAVLIPWAIPTIVSARMWSWMLNDQYGVINEILVHLGIIAAPIAWTANGDYALAAVIAVDVWKTTPFMTLLILAALQLLPGEIYEAGKVDGISPVRMFFQVTLPLIRPALMVAIIFRALDALRIYDLIHVLTSGSRDTMSMSFYARQELVDFSHVGIGSAASTLLFLIIAIITVIYITAGRVKLGER